MTKRLVSTDERIDKIINIYKESGMLVSKIVNDSILNNVLPIFSRTLRTEALYLLDVITNGAKDWTGNKLMLSSEKGLVSATEKHQFVVMQTLGRGVLWLKKHNIQDCSVLREIAMYYYNSSLSGGVKQEELNEYVLENINCVIKKLKEIDSKYNEIYIGLGQLVLDVLDHWDELWNWEYSYDLISSLIYCDSPRKDIEPMRAINIMQMFETQFIMEMIED